MSGAMGHLLTMPTEIKSMENPIIIKIRKIALRF